jgi:hypothetical protein
LYCLPALSVKFYKLNNKSSEQESSRIVWMGVLTLKCSAVTIYKITKALDMVKVTALIKLWKKIFPCTEENECLGFHEVAISAAE